MKVTVYTLAVRTVYSFILVMAIDAIVKGGGGYRNIIVVLKHQFFLIMFMFSLNTFLFVTLAS